jgi:hypothetical protein
LPIGDLHGLTPSIFLGRSEGGASLVRRYLLYSNYTWPSAKSMGGCERVGQHEPLTSTVAPKHIREWVCHLGSNASRPGSVGVAVIPRPLAFPLVTVLCNCVVMYFVPSSFPDKRDSHLTAFPARVPASTFRSCMSTIITL